MMESHVVCLTETWMKPTDIMEDFQNHNTIRSDNRMQHQHRSGGLLMLINYHLHVLHFSQEDIDLEHQMAIVGSKIDPSIRLCIQSVYRNPRIPVTSFFTDLEKIISALPDVFPSFILGDFNIDTSSSTQTTRTFLGLLRYYRFHPCVPGTKTTHRQGGQLDNIFINFSVDTCVDIIPKYYSDHFLLSLAVPWSALLWGNKWLAHYLLWDVYLKLSWQIIMQNLYDFFKISLTFTWITPIVKNKIHLNLFLFLEILISWKIVPAGGICPVRTALFVPKLFRW